MYQSTNRISFSMVDENNLLTLPQIIDFFQDCCFFQGQDIGNDLETLAKRHRSWLLGTWHVVVNRYPNMGERVTIKTWPYAFKTIYGKRNFTLETNSGEVLAYADSHWFYFDTQNQKPTVPTQEELSLYELEEPYPMPMLSRRIDYPDQLEQIDQIKVGRIQLDMNHHMNNGEYVRISSNYVPANVPISELRIEYKNAALLGDQLDVYINDSPEYFYVILKKDTLISTIAQFKKGQ